MTTDNPYATPPGDNPSNPYVAPASYAPRPQGNPLIIPAIFILIFSGLYFLILLLSLPQQIADMRQADTGTPAGIGEVVGQGIFLFAAITCSLLEIYGATCMLRMKQYGFAMASAILSLIPFCSPCFVLGIPFGIWSLVVLAQSEVKSRFHK